MEYKEKEQNNTTVDQAWNRLHQWLEQDGLLPEANGDKQKTLSGIVFKSLSAAAVLAVCIFLGWYFTRLQVYDKELLILYNEANAPTLATMLEDGSVVYLSEETLLSFPDRFANDKREVVLQGEAFFNIKKQVERPFFIETDLARIEVTGTSFNVKSHTGDVFLLSVKEGEVCVTQKNRRQVLSVKAGETVLFDSEQLQLAKNTIEFDDYFKQIHFKDENLKNVVNIINMHADATFIKIDPKVETRTLTFTFSKNKNIEEIAEVICLALDLQHAQQDNTIYISEKR
jgi:Fe2+-dicitrate sensor, membrane component